MKRPNAEFKALLPAKKNRKSGTKKLYLPPLRKGLLNAALDFWLVKNGGNCPIRSSVLWPKRRAV